MNKKRQFRRKGFTLVELMGSVVISTAIILMLYKVFDKVQSVFMVSQNRARAMEQGRIGMDMLVRDFQVLRAAELNTLAGSVTNIVWMDKVDANASDSLRPFDDPNPKFKSQDLFGHHFQFFTHDEDWRIVDYKLASRGDHKSKDPASPVGTLWMYRSKPVLRVDLLEEFQDYNDLLGGIAPAAGEPRYERVIDGVVSFRVRAASPRAPFELEERPPTAPSPYPYIGPLVPSHVEVELAVVDEKLVAEMEEGIGQRMEGTLVGLTGIAKAEAQRSAKLEFLKKNLHRVYFYKQLIHIEEN